MSMRDIVKGSTDESVVIRIIDSTDGTPEQTVEHDTAGIAMWYRREGATKQTVATAALAALDTAHADGGIEHIDDGYYRFDLPDAAFAAGVNGVMIGGAVTDMIVMGCYVPLPDVDPYDAVRMGLTALPNANADAAGGLPISDAGGLDLDGVLSGNTPQGADNNTILAHADYGNAQLVRSTTPANKLDVSATGEGGLDFDNIKDATGAHTLTNITVPTVSTLTGHTAQSANNNTILAHADYGLAKLVRSTTPANALDVSATGEAGLDFDNIKDATGAKTLTNITIPVVTSVGTTTTNSDMVGTNNAALATKLTKYVQLMTRKDAAIATDNGTELTEINTDGGSGGGTFSNQTDAEEAISDRGDTAWITATGFSTSGAMTTAQNDLDTITGSDGVTLATAQGLYAPAKAGDAMTLSSGAVTAAVIATDAIDADSIKADAVTLIQSGLATGANVTSAHSTTDAVIAALNNISVAQVNAEVDTALSDYDGPTKAEMDTAHALLATVAKQDVIDGIVDSILVDTALVDKWLKNKIAFSGTSMVLYDNDNSTPLLTWTLSEGSTSVSGPYNRAKAT